VVGIGILTRKSGLVIIAFKMSSTSLFSLSPRNSVCLIKLPIKISYANWSISSENLFSKKSDSKIYRRLFLKLHREEKEILESDFLEKRFSDEIDQLAYDILMGNFIRHTLFLGDKENKDVEDILNAMMTKPDFLVKMPIPTTGTDNRTLKKNRLHFS
jgi:hypothetical protein